MIDKKSRYHGVPTFTTVDPVGETISLLELRDIPQIEAVFATLPREGERLDNLAWRYYRNPLAFWRICDASDHMDPYDVVEPGESLPIPPER